jgi:F420H(2)-dependent quinone reductase
MTAIAQEPQLPPRPLIRAVWLGQRAAYRLTRGRFGLATPEAGKSFGMLRLETVGRRSGKARIAIIGYYQDGANLVTLAMNGWGTTEPAWWLNLQASPEATVRVPGAEFPVRARVATGEERARLWAKFDEFPGWGADLDGLAGRRPMETSVVVLEPKTAQGAVFSTPAGSPSEAAVTTAVEASKADPAAAAAPRGRRLRARHLWLIPGLAIAFFANFQAADFGIGIVPLIAMGLAPDVARVTGLRRPFAVGVHNVLHQPVLPIAVLLGNAIVGSIPLAYIGGLVWLGHIVMGWGVGDRVRPSQPATPVVTSVTVAHAS